MNRGQRHGNDGMSQKATDNEGAVGGKTTATLTFAADDGERPVSASSVPGGRIRQLNGGKDERRIVIHDGRKLGPTSLEREGFVLANHASSDVDFSDEEEVRRSYYGDCETLVGRLSGARRVVVFDHTIRHGSETEQERRRVREPVRVVHNDYTDWSGPQRVRDLFPDEAEALLGRRMAVIQVWRPIASPVMADPLAICDAGSLSPADLIAAERRHADRVGEIYHVAFNPAQRWYYFPRMASDEAIVFKCYDSMTDGRARFTAHASFVDPETPEGAPPRESIEIRTFAFF